MKAQCFMKNGSDETDEEEGEEAEGHTSMSRQIPNFDENN